MRGRIKPNIVKSQYGSKPNMLDGFNLHIEGQKSIRFNTKQEAKDYAKNNNIELPYNK